MSGYYTIIIKFKTTPDKKKDFKRFLESIVPIALKSQGCIRHDLHESLDDAAEFLFYENWTSKEAHEKHVVLPEVQKWRNGLDNFLAEPYEVTFWKTLSWNCSS